MSLIFYVIAVTAVVSVMLSSYFLGQRHKDRATGSQYESGILDTGSARVRFPAQFYLIAMFFVIFDLESVFIYAWSVSVRELGFPGFIHMCIFVAILLVALAYLWRTGALDIGPLPHREKESQQ